MPLRPEDVPSDPARLGAMVLALDTENERLRAIVRTLKDLLFGARSERAAVIDVAQLPLDLDDLAVGPTPPPPPANAKRADRVKILAFDGTGLILATKRLEEGRFTWPPIQGGVVRLTAAQFSMLVDGLDWTRVSPRPVRRPLRVG